MDFPEWRFPDNNYTCESGLDTSDMETFKKDPISSLAREVCQNSIDAPSGDAPVRVEFSLFEMNHNAIPGYSELSKQIHACYDYKGESEKEGKALETLCKSIDKDTITCMRISDFNTTGVTGVDSKLRSTPFYNLTKGSGVSDKGDSSGGSKGIGKFASFVVSATNTVFYSTKTQDGAEGYIGISKLRSTPIPGEDEELMTMGTGYYALTQKNHPVQTELHLDPDFARADGQSGTDIYLIGFNKTKYWTTEVLAKVLEGFMVAIVRKKLEVIVDGIEVNANTIEDIVYGEDLDAFATKTIIKDVKAQYELLMAGEGVKVDEVQIDDDTTVTVYMKEYSQQDASKATKRCIMIRYPYMKIKHITTGAYLPFSALCVIEENSLNDKLRHIENPQHTDWEIKRLNDYPEEKKEVNKSLKTLQANVKQFIIDSLRESSGESTDIIGAGEFLPSQDDFGETMGQPTTEEVPKTSKIKTTKIRVPKSLKTGEHGESLDFSNGDEGNDGEDGSFPGGEGGGNPNPYDYPESDPADDKKIDDGDNPVLKKVALSGMRYRNVVRNAASGEYTCMFTSAYDENNCEVQIRQCGEATDKYPLEIISASIAGVPCEVKNGKIIGLSIKNGTTYRIDYEVSKSEMFASEVIVNACR